MIESIDHVAVVHREGFIRKLVEPVGKRLSLVGCDVFTGQ
jgi:hypothetical protein